MLIKRGSLGTRVKTHPERIGGMENGIGSLDKHLHITAYAGFKTR